MSSHQSAFVISTASTVSALKANGTKPLSSGAVPVLNLVAMPAVSADLLSRGPSSHPHPAPMAQRLQSYHAEPDERAAGKKRGKILVWFRMDLRVHDNPALLHAAEEGAEVVPLYCYDPRHFGRTPFGFEKTGRVKATFLMESVRDLRKSLKKMGSGLVVRIGKPEEVIPQICKKTGCKRVFYHQEVTFEQQELEEKLEAALKEVGIEAKQFWTNTLYHPEDMPFDLSHVPDVYTKFREAVQQNALVREPLTVDELPPLPKIDEGKLPSMSDLGLTEMDPETWKNVMYIPGGETEAMRRLEQHVEETKKTPVGRPASLHLCADFSCKISPWLALGCMSPRKIYAVVKRESPPKGRSNTLFELVWRDFFRFITHKYGRARLLKRARRIDGTGSVSSTRVDGAYLRPAASTL